MEMLPSKWNLFIRLSSSVTLFVVSDIGDALTGIPDVQSCPPLLALIDSTIHSVIGFLTWNIIEPTGLLGPSLELITVTMGAALIDLDHFIVAGSLRIRDVIRNPYRGMFHCSGLLSLVTLCLAVISPKASLLLLLIFVPHHLRDSTRRGLYLFYPYVHSNPLPKLLVNSLLVFFPWIILALVQIGLLPMSRSYSEKDLGKVKDAGKQSFTV